MNFLINKTDPTLRGYYKPYKVTYISGSNTITLNATYEGSIPETFNKK